MGLGARRRACAPRRLGRRPDRAEYDHAMTKDTNATVGDLLDAARANGSPELYVNNLGVALGSSDVLLLLERNNTPVGIVNLSFTSAKSLAVALGQIIAELEQRANREILTNEDIAGLFSKGEEPGDGDVLPTH